MTVTVREYKKSKRVGYEVDIRFDWPDGTEFRRRYRAPVHTKTQASAWGRNREVEILTGGKDGPLTVSKRAQGTNGKEMSGSVMTGQVVQLTTDPTSETVSKWYERYFAWREGKARGAESISDSRGRFKKWVEPKLGACSMRSVTRTQLEDLVAFLDEQVDEEVIAAKTAINIWGEVTAGFRIATKCKDRSLRVLEVNPADAVEGPDKDTDKQKPFLRPDEVVKLLGCRRVPLERRQVYAMALYTAMRQGELRGLRVSEVDLDAMQISVVRQTRDGVEKERTKTGRARTVTIEPNLLPLLRVLMRGKKRDDVLLWVGARNRCAAFLREDLLAAGCKRDALHVAKADPMRVRMKFHNLRDTCLTHMAMRKDPPQDIQWRAGHTTPAMTEAYITNARYQAGANFGTPLPQLPADVLGETVEKGAA